MRRSLVPFLSLATLLAASLPARADVTAPWEGGPTISVQKPTAPPTPPATPAAPAPAAKTTTPTAPAASAPNRSTPAAAPRAAPAAPAEPQITAEQLRAIELRNRGGAAMDEGDYQTAADDFRKALHQTPGDPTLLALLRKAEDRMTAIRSGERAKAAAWATPPHPPRPGRTGTAGPGVSTADHDQLALDARSEQLRDAVASPPGTDHDAPLTPCSSGGMGTAAHCLSAEESRENLRPRPADRPVNGALPQLAGAASSGQAGKEASNQVDAKGRIDCQFGGPGCAPVTAVPSARPTTSAGPPTSPQPPPAVMKALQSNADYQRWTEQKKTATADLSKAQQHQQELEQKAKVETDPVKRKQLETDAVIAQGPVAAAQSTIASADANIQDLTRTLTHKIEAKPAAHPVVTVPPPPVQ